MATIEVVKDEALPTLTQEVTKLTPISDITIGHAAAAEAAAIAKIGWDTFTATFGHSAPPEDITAFLASTYVEASMLADLNDPAVETLVARDVSGKVLGLIQLVRDLPLPPKASNPLPSEFATVVSKERKETERPAELRRLYIDMTAQGRGIGTQLIAAVEARAREEGFDQLWLSVWLYNPLAQKLYERLGYENIGATDFVMGSCAQTDWVYAKDL